uniref:Uncharacterized protein n=1 Tax=Lepeophtheirus salmonis TaxID=72036 RepID=A0A0K2UD28_LEPSM
MYGNIHNINKTTAFPNLGLACC